MKKLTMIIAATFTAAAMWAAVGPQSVRVTFNEDDNAEGWVISSGGSQISVADGVYNVQMAVQSSGKYRGDFQFNTGGIFTFDKTKDVVWAIKLTGALPGTANSRKFEIQYKNAEDANVWINGINGPSGSLDCADGGKIYYFNLGSDGLNKLSAVQDGTVAINQIHFILADATELTDETAVYAVDWVASFASVNDMKAFQDWNDEAQDAVSTLPLLELCFRPKADGTGYDNRRNGFTNDSFEGNYKARLFGIEYFLVENFDAEESYRLQLTTVGGGGTDSLAVWDFPYEVNYEASAADMNSYAAAVVGYAPGTTGDMNEPIAAVPCNKSVWSFDIPGSALTPLTTNGDNTLVALLVTSFNHAADKKGKYASASHETVAVPSFAIADSDPTAVSNIAAETKVSKVIRNGQVVIIRNGEEFDLLGSKL